MDEPPQIIYDAGEYSFVRLFEEKSFEETRTAVRRKLGLSPQAPLRLAQIRGDSRYPLADADDWNAFRAYVRTRNKGTIEVTVRKRDVKATWTSDFVAEKGPEEKKRSKRSREEEDEPAAEPPVSKKQAKKAQKAKEDAERDSKKSKAQSKKRARSPSPPPPPSAPKSTPKPAKNKPAADSSLSDAIERAQKKRKVAFEEPAPVTAPAAPASESDSDSDSDSDEEPAVASSSRTPVPIADSKADRKRRDSSSASAKAPAHLLLPVTPKAGQSKRKDKPQVTPSPAPPAQDESSSDEAAPKPATTSAAQTTAAKSITPLAKASQPSNSQAPVSKTSTPAKGKTASPEAPEEEESESEEEASAPSSSTTPSGEVTNANAGPKGAKLSAPPSSKAVPAQPATPVQPSQKAPALTNGKGKNKAAASTSAKPSSSAHPRQITSGLQRILDNEGSATPQPAAKGRRASMPAPAPASASPAPTSKPDGKKEKKRKRATDGAAMLAQLAPVESSEPSSAAPVTNKKRKVSENAAKSVAPQPVQDVASTPAKSKRKTKDKSAASASVPANTLPKSADTESVVSMDDGTESVSRRKRKKSQRASKANMQLEDDQISVSSPRRPARPSMLAKSTLAPVAKVPEPATEPTARASTPADSGSGSAPPAPAPPRMDVRPEPSLPAPVAAATKPTVAAAKRAVVETTSSPAASPSPSPQRQSAPTAPTPASSQAKIAKALPTVSAEATQAAAESSGSESDDEDTPPKQTLQAERAISPAPAITLTTPAKISTTSTGFRALAESSESESSDEEAEPTAKQVAAPVPTVPSQPAAADASSSSSDSDEDDAPAPASEPAPVPEPKQMVTPMVATAAAPSSSASDEDEEEEEDEAPSKAPAAKQVDAPVTSTTTADADSDSDSDDEATSTPAPVATASLSNVASRPDAPTKVVSPAKPTATSASAPSPSPSPANKRAAASQAKRAKPTPLSNDTEESLVSDLNAALEHNAREDVSEDEDAVPQGKKAGQQKAKGVLTQPKAAPAVDIGSDTEEEEDDEEDENIGKKDGPSKTNAVSSVVSETDVGVAASATEPAPVPTIDLTDEPTSAANHVGAGGVVEDEDEAICAACQESADHALESCPVVLAGADSIQETLDALEEDPELASPKDTAKLRELLAKARSKSSPPKPPSLATALSHASPVHISSPISTPISSSRPIIPANLRIQEVSVETQDEGSSAESDDDSDAEPFRPLTQRPPVQSQSEPEDDALALLYGTQKSGADAIPSSSEDEADEEEEEEEDESIGKLELDEEEDLSREVKRRRNVREKSSSEERAMQREDEEDEEGVEPRELSDAAPVVMDPDVEMEVPQQDVDDTDAATSTAPPEAKDEDEAIAESDAPQLPASELPTHPMVEEPPSAAQSPSEDTAVERSDAGDASVKQPSPALEVADASPSGDRVEPPTAPVVTAAQEVRPVSSWPTPRLSSSPVDDVDDAPAGSPAADSPDKDDIESVGSRAPSPPAPEEDPIEPSPQPEEEGNDLAPTQATEHAESSGDEEEPPRRTTRQTRRTTRSQTTEPTPSTSSQPAPPARKGRARLTEEEKARRQKEKEDKAAAREAERAAKAAAKEAEKEEKARIKAEKAQAAKEAREAKAAAAAAKKKGPVSKAAPASKATSSRSVRAASSQASEVDKQHETQWTALVDGPFSQERERDPELYASSAVDELQSSPKGLGSEPDVADAGLRVPGSSQFPPLTPMPFGPRREPLFIPDSQSQFPATQEPAQQQDSSEDERPARPMRITRMKGAPTPSRSLSQLEAQGRGVFSQPSTPVVELPPRGTGKRRPTQLTRTVESSSSSDDSDEDAPKKSHIPKGRRAGANLVRKPSTGARRR